MTWSFSDPTRLSMSFGKKEGNDQTYKDGVRETFEDMYEISRLNIIE